METGDIVGTKDCGRIGYAPCQSAAHYTAAATACSGVSQLHGCLCKPVSARLSEAGQHHSCLYSSKQSVAAAHIHKLLFCIYIVKQNVRAIWSLVQNLPFVVHDKDIGRLTL